MNVNWFSTSFSNKMKKLSNASRTKETAPIMPLHFIKSEQEYYRNGTKTRTPNEQHLQGTYTSKPSLDMCNEGHNFLLEVNTCLLECSPSLRTLFVQVMQD